MPPSSVPRKVEDIIFYYYAKLVIAPSAGFPKNYRFIIDSYKRLKTGELRMSDYEREIQHSTEGQKACVFCGSSDEELKPVHVVPRSFGVTAGMHNLVMACGNCAQSKEEKDLVEWWCKELKKARDDLPRLALGIYLKIAFELHKVRFSLQKPCNSLGELFSVL
jgi:hypothetical protein